METISLDHRASGRSRILSLCILAALTFILYGNTIFHDYALDDSMAITRNRFTQRGFAGIKDIFTHNTWEGWHGLNRNISSGGRYRPLSLVTFAVEYQFFRQNPHINHFVNILLYAATVILIFLLCVQLSGSMTGTTPIQKWYLSLPFLTALLFAAHPVHTEIVANIKGRDDIMAFMFSLITLLVYIRLVKSARWYLFILSGFLFFLALLSKEGSVTFVIMIPLTTWFFIDKNVKRNLFAAIPLLVAAGIFIGIRYSVLNIPDTYTANDLINNSFIEASISEKYGTILYTFGLYIKLLFFPHPLTVDYYPYHISLVKLQDIRAIISFCIYAMLFYHIITGFMKRSVVTYTLLVFLIPLSLVSNIPFPVGVFMSERFLYVPSFAFSLLAAWFLVDKLPYMLERSGKISVTRYMKLAPVPVILIITLFSIKTIHRNMAWKNDYTLFSADVKTSKNSAFSNSAYGQLMLSKGRESADPEKKEKYLRIGITHLRKALEIHPTHEEVLKDLGMTYQSLGNIDSTIYYLECFTETNQDTFANYSHLGFLYGKEKNDCEKAIHYFEKAMKIRPEEMEPYLLLSTVLKQNNKPEKAAEYLEKALTKNPADLRILQNLCYLYAMQGDTIKLNRACEKAYNHPKTTKDAKKKIIQLFDDAAAQLSSMQKDSIK